VPLLTAGVRDAPDGRCELAVRVAPAVVDRHDVPMAKDRRDLVMQARAALIMAAMRRSLVTYKELGTAIGIDGVALRNEMRHVLDELSDDCHGRNEPTLAALVVNARTGAPGAGWRDGPNTPWYQEVQAAFRRWTTR
jgi:hypothetical protein